MHAAKSILASLVLVFSAIPALALSPAWQRHTSPSRPAQQAPSSPPRNDAAPASSQGSDGSYQFHLNGPGPHRGDWLRKYMALPPDQQEKQLEQDPSFRNLPAEKQNHLLDRLRKFNSQPPEKKAQILNRMETFEHMTPEQQAAARNLFERYRNLPDDQKTKVSQAYRRLRGMPPQARNQLLSSDEFRTGFTDDERDLLRGMTDLNVEPSH
ncbi:MAG: DUF3106 domain-containing protein [Candidatus Korobacteraceae bacterium]